MEDPPPAPPPLKEDPVRCPRLTATLAALVLVACEAPAVGPVAPEASEEVSPTFTMGANFQGRIAFGRFDGDHWDIYVVNADGSGLTNLTGDAATDLSPAFSPNGKQIAFTKLLDGEANIFVMNADGSGVTQLTDAGGGSPSWSPNGKQIAFTSDRDGPTDIFVMNADGTGQTNVTRSADALETSPAWSPNGKQIAFTRREVGDDLLHVFVMNADGTDQTQLTGGRNFGPAWSPNGNRIAFTSQRDDGTARST